MEKESRTGKIRGKVSLIGGILCLVYFVAVAFMGHGTNFYFIWLLGGIFFLLLGLALLREWTTKIPKMLKRVFCACLILGMLTVATVEGFVLSGFWQNTEESLDYLIVLGAQMKTTGPSVVLQMRLDTAYEYLVEHENTIVIVSGGKGSNEPVSEAQGMYDYLVEKGISPDRIIKEEFSRNTSENIENSCAYLDKENSRVGIVTNNFHVFRAVQIAKKKGISNIYGIAAPSYLPMLPNNMLREFFGVAKDFMLGNM